MTPVGIAHDYLLVMRGAERTFAEIASIWSDAPIYTLLYDEAGTAGRFADREIHTSFLQRTGAGQRGFRRLLPLMPSATDRLAIGDHDLVVSSSSAFAHGIHTEACHVCYCHSPFRYVWHERELALAEAPAPLRPPTRLLLERIRRWDRAAAARVNHYIANSRLTRERIRSFYGRDAPVVHPPVATARFSPGEPEDYFLVVTELAHHKRVDVALEAARRARRPIRVVGEGPARDALADRFPEARFLGRVGDAELPSIYAGALALVLPNVEEFGIAAVEAMASGRPVIAAAAGGALETVAEGVSGLLLPPGDVQALAAVLADFDPGDFDPDAIAAHARRFSIESFRETLRDEVAKLAAL